jgi:hypothetical protein
MLTSVLGCRAKKEKLMSEMRLEGQGVTVIVLLQRLGPILRFNGL